MVQNLQATQLLDYAGTSTDAPAARRRCRSCHSPLGQSFLDLGASPLCESFLSAEELHQPESFYPLHAFVCTTCFLVQVEDHVSGEHIFGGEYAYFSSYSDSWLAHARGYVDRVVKRFGLNGRSHVVEVASNDGYLLTAMLERGIPCLGIEPAANVAEAAIKKGVPTLVRFFGTELANQLADSGRQADLLVGNNVLAHVPDLNDFVAGMKILLKADGVLSMEFPHLTRLIEGNQFDTIYQEHYSYFSFFVVERIFASHGLTLFDVEELPTHGGSLRIFARHHQDDSKPVLAAADALREREYKAGLDRLEPYNDFAERVAATKRQLLAFLIEAKREGKTIVGYGAPGKGNVLLNYCGIRQDFVDYVVDRNPYKQHKYLPGTHIPVYAPDRVVQTQPDYVLILPWNLRDEIMQQLDYVRDWGAQFIIPIPVLEVC